MKASSAIPKTLLWVYVALLVLLAATVGLATVEWGWLGLVVALGIAVTKAVLIVWYFMEVRDASRLTLITIGAACFWLGILLVLTLSDYLTRGWNPAVGK